MSLTRNTRSSSMVLYDEQWDWFDDLHTQVQRGGWRRARKSDVMRGVLSAIMDFNVDLAGCTSEEEIARRVRQVLYRGY